MNAIPRCVLCCISAADSVEHIPPRQFFERPYPPNLITVPSCEPCNHGTHLDDDYLLAYLVSLDIPGASPTLNHIRERVTRGLHRPQFPGLIRRLRRALRIGYEADPITGSRVVRFGIVSEPSRLTRVLRKQVRGLTYYVTGRQVRRSTFMQLERLHFRHTRPTEFWKHWVGASDYAMAAGKTGAVGDVFRWHYREVRRSALASVVRLEYYGVFAFIALIYRPDFSPPQRVAFPF